MIAEKIQVKCFGNVCGNQKRKGILSEGAVDF